MACVLREYMRRRVQVIKVIDFHEYMLRKVQVIKVIETQEMSRYPPGSPSPLPLGPTFERHLASPPEAAEDVQLPPFAPPPQEKQMQATAVQSAPRAPDADSGEEKDALEPSPAALPAIGRQAGVPLPPSVPPGGVEAPHNHNQDETDGSPI
eukprot:NODE_4038_length_716_cov_266.400908.p2 GENE.NODE_4038_length_716_cov_266.400908~~NODE_4038_length_716_cov_266.400908.p2  ORF type:complete len:175 (+),score=33.86 NODE_4038_length_716_cov_266.400908:70-525(+)